MTNYTDLRHQLEDLQSLADKEKYKTEVDKSVNIYIAIWKDRHSDTTAHPFSSKEKATDWAKAKAKEYAREEGDYEEHDYGRDQGWCFYADYSCEGDCIYVVESELDNEKM